MAEAVYLSDFLPKQFQTPYNRQIVLGILSMALAGVIHPVLGVLLFAIFLVMVGTPLHKILRKGSTGILILFTAAYVLDPSVLLLVLFTLYFQMLYFWGARKPVQYLWITAVGFVHLAIVSTITGSVIFPFIFVAYVIVLTQSLLVSNYLTGLSEEDGTVSQSQLRTAGSYFIRKMKKIGYWIGGISLLIAVAFFPFLPRFNRLSYQPTQFTQASVTGFSDEVILGEMGEISTDNRVALRIFAAPNIGSRVQRWRGASLEDWEHEKQRWSSRTNRDPIMVHQAGNWIDLYSFGPTVEVPYSEERLRVNVNSMPSPMVFLPELGPRPPRESTSVRGGFDQIDFDHLAWTCDLPAEFAFRSFEYEIRLLADSVIPSSTEDPTFGRLTKRPKNPDYIQRCLSLDSVPEDFQDELRKKIREILSSGGPVPEDSLSLAKKLNNGVQRSQPYTLDYTKENSAKNLREFLSEGKAGHCEYFATTLALMLRLENVPSRILTGFRPGRTNFFNNYQIVRQSDAHSWVEAFLGPGLGWASFDPTPSSSEAPGALAQNLGFLMDIYDYFQLQWNRHILDYSNDDQRQIFGIMFEGLRLVVGPALVGAWVIAYMRKILAGALFVLFLVWLFREVGPELGPIFQSWRVRLPILEWFGRKGRERHLATRLFKRLEKEWARQGFKRSPCETPRRYFERVVSKTPEALAASTTFLAVYYATRFGASSAEGDLGKALRQSAFDLLRQARSRPR
jgi:hypothetical protein